MIDDLKIGIYEFLLKCKPVLEEDGEYLSDGTVENHSQYHMSCNWQDMETLAYDIGVTIRETTGETSWDAIKRYMENEINAEKKESPDKD